jgi:hypothetical protein
MIRENLSARSKEFLVRGGDARVFGDDTDARRKFSDDEVVERFRNVWHDTIAPNLREAPIVTPEEARELVGESRARFVQAGYVFRQFTVDTAAFVARLTTPDADAECDQLWSIGGHQDPTRLCVYFEKVEHLERFSDIARDLGHGPRDLLLELAMDFLYKFPDKP